MSGGGVRIGLAEYARHAQRRNPLRLWKVIGIALTPLRAWWFAPLSLAAERAAQGREGPGGSTKTTVTVKRHDIAPERDSFDAFFARHMPPLYGYVRRLVEVDDAASDITQETFFRAWMHFEDITGYARPEAWLYRVATNLAMSHLRKRHPVSLSWLEQQGHNGSLADAAYGAYSPDGMESPFAVAASLEDATAERDLINHVLRELPERQRAVLLLRAVHDFSYVEIASMLDVAVPNVYQLLSRACKRFRDCYGVSENDRAVERKLGGAR